MCSGAGRFLDGRFNEFIELLPAQQRVTADWYKGTADAVYQNLDLLRRHAPKHVLVLAGDHVYKMDYARMLVDHAAREADLTIACIEVPLADASAFGVMQIDERSGSRASRKSRRSRQPVPGRTDVALASMGIYVFNASVPLRAADPRCGRAAVEARFRRRCDSAPDRARLPRERAPVRG